MQIPKNVVQTGQVDACRKIYIEDYVHTFLKQYQKKEADFCLYGTRETEDGVSYYFLYGAAKEEPGWETMEKRYFSGYQRIGEATFDEKDSWFFFEDGYSAAMDGYFVFYEQNEDMQSYLIAMHQNQPGEKPAEVRPRTIHRKPRVYDQPSVETEPPRGKGEDGSAGPVLRTREKALHAAQAGDKNSGSAVRAGERQRSSTPQFRRQGRNHAAVPGGKEGVPSIFPAGRGAAAALLMILCAVAVVSLSRPEEMREAGNFFAEAARELEAGSSGGGDGEGGDAGNGADQGESRGNTAFLVEERKLSDHTLSSEAAQQTETETLFPIFTADLGSAEQAPEQASEQALDLASEEKGEAGGAASTVAADSAGEQTDAEAQTEETAFLEAGEEELAQETVPPEGEKETDSQEASSQEASAQPAASYVIQNGDSLAAICRRQYGSTDRMGEIASLNGLSDPNHLIPGQEILLPQ